jgi:hypothetical protein
MKLQKMQIILVRQLRGMKKKKNQSLAGGIKDKNN